MDSREWDLGSRLPRDRRSGDPQSDPTRTTYPTEQTPWSPGSVTDTGSLEPIPDAVNWAMRADAWAQQQPAEPSGPWSDTAARRDARPAFPPEGVGWRSHTAEWRSSTESAHWRSTTEWRSSTGNHHWRSTIEAGWQTGDNGDLRRPPAEPPTRQPAISGTAWPTHADPEPLTDPTPSWQRPGGDPPPRPSARETDAPTWQQPAPGGGGSAWQQPGGTAWPSAPAAAAPGRLDPPVGQPEGYAGSWSGPGGALDDGRHLVREDDRARWSGAAQGDAPYGGRRRAADPAPETYPPSTGTGWAATSEADNWAGHTDTGALPMYQGGTSWREPATTWREPAPAPAWRDDDPVPSWRTGTNLPAPDLSDDRPRRADQPGRPSWSSGEDSRGRPAGGTWATGTAASGPAAGTWSAGTAASGPAAGTWSAGTAASGPAAGTWSTGTAASRPTADSWAGDSEPATESWSTGTPPSDRAPGTWAPGTAASGPAAGRWAPGTAASDPAAGTWAPGTAASDPATGSWAPGTAASDPTTGSWAPGTAASDPPAGTWAPGTAASGPAAGTWATGASAPRPGPGIWDSEAAPSGPAGAPPSGFLDRPAGRRGEVPQYLDESGRGPAALGSGAASGYGTPATGSARPSPSQPDSDRRPPSWSTPTPEDLRTKPTDTGRHTWPTSGAGGPGWRADETTTWSAGPPTGAPPDRRPATGDAWRADDTGTWRGAPDETGRWRPTTGGGAWEAAPTERTGWRRGDELADSGPADTGSWQRDGDWDRSERPRDTGRGGRRDTDEPRTDSWQRSEPRTDPGRDDRRPDPRTAGPDSWREAAEPRAARWRETPAADPPRDGNARGIEPREADPRGINRRDADPRGIASRDADRRDADWRGPAPSGTWRETPDAPRTGPRRDPDPRSAPPSDTWRDPSNTWRDPGPGDPRAGSRPPDWRDTPATDRGPRTDSRRDGPAAVDPRPAGRRAEFGAGPGPDARRGPGSCADDVPTSFAADARRGPGPEPGRRAADPSRRESWQDRIAAENNGSAGAYRSQNTGDWRRELAAEGGTDELAPGESRRYGTHDFPQHKSGRSRGSASVASPLSADVTMVGAVRPVSAGGPVDPAGRRPELLVASRSGAGWQDPPSSTWPPPGAGGGYDSVAGPYERRAVGTLTRPSARARELDEVEDGFEEVRGGPLAAVGFTAMWYGVPVVLFVLYMLVLDSSQQGHALDTLISAAPRFGLSLVLSMAVAVGLRMISGTWKAASVGLAAAVVGGGLATVLVSAFTGQSLS